MHVTIREYSDSDKNFLLQTINQLHNYVVQLDPVKRLRNIPGYAEHELNEILQTVAKQDGKIYIADFDSKQIGVIAGFLTEQSKFNLLSVVPTKLGVISDVFVDKQYRGQHVGTQLIEEMESYLIGKGCDTIWITIVAFNENAHAFYKKHGYKDREIGLMKKMK